MVHFILTLTDEALRITELDAVYNQNMENIPMDMNKSDCHIEESPTKDADPDIFLPDKIIVLDFGSQYNQLIAHINSHLL